MPTRSALGTSYQDLALNQKLALTSTNNHETPQSALHDALYQNERLDGAGDGNRNMLGEVWFCVHYPRLARVSGDVNTLHVLIFTYLCYLGFYPTSVSRDTAYLVVVKTFAPPENTFQGSKLLHTRPADRTTRHHKHTPRLADAASVSGL